ncbi:16S rRNA (cytosine(1402)-N(4))-methyltransferase RsmH [soil metagenome]
MPGEFRHLPVMVDEVVALFAPVPAGVVVDATVGGGGHAAALLDAHPHLYLLGIDRDRDAIAAAAARLAAYGDRARLHHARFDALTAAVAAEAEHLGERPVTGVLFDLGVSSWQLDNPERGFSYRADAPLDMRMDRTGGPTAADVVNVYPEAELARVLRRYGDERFARRIAHAVVAARPVATTGELAEIVRTAIPAAARRHGGHPAKRSFQALRIEVNGELASLAASIDRALAVLAPGGRAVVLTYHSGEDRIVKDRFHHAATGGVTPPPGLPPPAGVHPSVRLLRPASRTPSVAEATTNRRAGSARLRAVEKLPEEAS